jgi:hypothetical protein
MALQQRFRPLPTIQGEDAHSKNAVSGPQTAAPRVVLSFRDAAARGKGQKISTVNDDANNGTHINGTQNSTDSTMSSSSSSLKILGPLHGNTGSYSLDTLPPCDSDSFDGSSMTSGTGTFGSFSSFGPGNENGSISGSGSMSHRRRKARGSRGRRRGRPGASGVSASKMVLLAEHVSRRQAQVARAALDIWRATTVDRSRREEMSRASYAFRVWRKNVLEERARGFRFFSQRETFLRWSLHAWHFAAAEAIKDDEKAEAVVDVRLTVGKEDPFPDLPPLLQGGIFSKTGISDGGIHSIAQSISTLCVPENVATFACSRGSCGRGQQCLSEDNVSDNEDNVSDNEDNVSDNDVVMVNTPQTASDFTMISGPTVSTLTTTAEQQSSSAHSSSSAPSTDRSSAENERALIKVADDRRKAKARYRLYRHRKTVARQTLLRFLIALRPRRERAASQQIRRFAVAWAHTQRARARRVDMGVACCVLLECVSLIHLRRVLKPFRGRVEKRVLPCMDAFMEAVDDMAEWIAARSDGWNGQSEAGHSSDDDDDGFTDASSRMLLGKKRRQCIMPETPDSSSAASRTTNGSHQHHDLTVMPFPVRETAERLTEFCSAVNRALLRQKQTTTAGRRSRGSSSSSGGGGSSTTENTIRNMLNVFASTPECLRQWCDVVAQKRALHPEGSIWLERAPFETVRYLSMGAYEMNIFEQSYLRCWQLAAGRPSDRIALFPPDMQAHDLQEAREELVQMGEHTFVPPSASTVTDSIMFLLRTAVGSEVLDTVTHLCDRTNRAVVKIRKTILSQRFKTRCRALGRQPPTLDELDISQDSLGYAARIFRAKYSRTLHPFINRVAVSNETFGVHEADVPKKSRSAVRSSSSSSSSSSKRAALIKAAPEASAEVSGPECVQCERTETPDGVVLLTFHSLREIVLCPLCILRDADHILQCVYSLGDGDDGDDNNGSGSSRRPSAWKREKKKKKSKSRSRTPERSRSVSKTTPPSSESGGDDDDDGVGNFMPDVASLLGVRN